MKKCHDQYSTFNIGLSNSVFNSLHFLHIHSLQFEILVTALVLLKDHCNSSDFVTNSYGESRDSSCEKS